MNQGDACKKCSQPRFFCGKSFALIVISFIIDWAGLSPLSRLRVYDKDGGDGHE
jgi:hypothetical protein